MGLLAFSASSTTVHAGLQVPPITTLPAEPAVASLWFDGADAAAVAALVARKTNPATSGYYSSFKATADGALGNIDSASDDRRSKVAKAAALLHLLGDTPASGFATYRDLAVAAILGIESRRPLGDFISPSATVNILQDSSRLQSICEAYDMLRGTGISAADNTTARRIIANWAFAIQNDWNLAGAFGVPGHRDNWGVKGGSALVTAALTLADLADAASWRDSGMIYLNESLGRVAGTTGWYAESPWYVNYSLANLAPAAYHAANHAGVDWFPALEPLVDAALAVRQPDGQAPPFEEGLSITFPHNVLAAQYPAKAGLMKWAWKHSPQNAINFENQHIHAVTRFIVVDITTTEVAPKTSPTRSLGPDTHMAVLADSWDGDAIQVTTMTAVDTSSDETFASRHHMENPLDLVLHANRLLLVPTAGGGPNVTGSPNRAEYLDPSSKNLPLLERNAPYVTDVADIDFGDRLDSYDVKGRANHFADIVRTTVSDAYDVGFGETADVRRAIVLVDEGYVAVLDRYSGGQINTDMQLSWRGRGVRDFVRDDDRHQTHRWKQAGNVGVQLDVTATRDLDSEVNTSLYSPAWNVEEEIQAVLVDATNARGARFLSVWQPVSGADADYTLTEESGGGGAAFTVAKAGTTIVDTIVSGRGGSDVDTADTQTDGMGALWRTDDGVLTSLAVIGATTLTITNQKHLDASVPVTLALTVGPDAGFPGSTGGNGMVVEISPDSLPTGQAVDLTLSNLAGFVADADYLATLNGVPLSAGSFSFDGVSFDFTGIGSGTLVVIPACRLGSGADPDMDRVCGDADNCPTTANADQKDTDMDDTGDACECLDAATRCDDGEFCTDNLCDTTTGACSNPPVDGTPACDDGNACTSPGVCQAGGCLALPVLCADSDPCTADSCDPATGCVFPAGNDGAVCDDGSACTDGDICDSGQCGGVGVVCTDSDPCTADSCDPATGCVFPAGNDGAVCDDGSACTNGDICDAGQCGGAGVVCTDSDPCTADSCDPATGCVFPIGNDGADCDDGSACTNGDICDAGQCGGAGVVCADSDPCTADSCDPAAGCVFPAGNDGADCDDGSACTDGDVCGGGQCGGVGVVCNDQNPCTNDSCDPGTGCVVTAIGPPDDGQITCDDNDACTENDVCGQGECGGSAVTCVDGSTCTTDTCDPASGCVFTSEPADTACDDGNECTLGDECDDSGQCAGIGMVCDDGNLCTSDSCDLTLGCAFEPVMAGQSCNDDNACTFVDLCDGNGGCAGTALTCQDTSPCTEDSCAPATGCVFNELPAGTPCNDSNACTTSDVCAGRDCGGEVVVCDDQDACTDDSCDPAVGCATAQAVDGTPCDDDDVCTGSDQCVAGVCGGEAADCDDDNACTDDACAPGGDCVNTPRAGGSPCNDGNSCTVSDQCVAGICAGLAASCDDGDPCTAETCDPVSGCVMTPVSGGGCDDENACTTGDACLVGECVGAVTTCDDANPCTDDSCLTDGSCAHAAGVDGIDCDDGDSCTEADSCALGVCGGDARDCDDGDSCTIDSCDADGCVNSIMACPDGTACEGGTCVQTACAPCESLADCGEGGTSACVMMVAGRRCVALCDEDADCADTELCVDSREGERVCVAAEGDCSELPQDPVEGDGTDDDTAGGDTAMDTTDEGDTTEETTGDTTTDDTTAGDTTAGDTTAGETTTGETTAGDTDNPDTAYDTSVDGTDGLPIATSPPQSFGGDDAAGCGECSGGDRPAPIALFGLLGLLVLLHRRRLAQRG
ncbi:MAG: MYXO-CTERM domain-containing protein [Myxococcota bacterium]|jgi:MYXO-CTERM domain-containing protein